MDVIFNNLKDFHEEKKKRKKVKVVGGGFKRKGGLVRYLLILL